MNPPSPTDLELRILEKQDRGYPVELTLGGEREFPRGYLSADPLSWASSQVATVEDRKGLFTALFSDPVLAAAWAEARGAAEQRCIRLRIDAGAPELHAVPWELMPEGDGVLSASPDTPFSRYLPIAMPWSGGKITGAVKVLAVISSPSDVTAQGLAPVDVELERETLVAAFSGVAPGRVKLDFLEGTASLEALDMALRGGYHVLHFVGHGAYSWRTGWSARTQARAMTPWAPTWSRCSSRWSATSSGRTSPRGRGREEQRHDPGEHQQACHGVVQAARQEAAGRAQGVQQPRGPLAGVVDAHLALEA